MISLENLEPKEGYFGQFSTDLLVELYFPGLKDGCCVEVGASNGTRGSNTLFFEQLGWRTLCIEPNPKYVDIIRETRKEVVSCACGERDKQDVPFTIFDIGKRNIMSSVSGLRPDKRLVDEHRDIINDKYEIKVNVKSLDTILTENSFSEEIDFISIDTEGTELDVLKGLSLDKWDVTLLVIENNYNDSDISAYMSKHGYFKDARWKHNDFYRKESK